MEDCHLGNLTKLKTKIWSEGFFDLKLIINQRKTREIKIQRSCWSELEDL
jgi:hypothetical protein